jgi:dTDP-4-amino-4,6-dideoxygalactose transaminase
VVAGHSNGQRGLAKRAKHLTTTAKVPHRWEFVHDEVGYNYRMPNINAALLVAQLEQLEGFLQNKRATAKAYEEFFSTHAVASFVKEPKNAKSNTGLRLYGLRARAKGRIFNHL